MPQSVNHHPVYNGLKALLLAGFLSSMAIADDNLPDIGSSTARVLSVQQEQLVGDDYMQQLRQFAPIMDDPELVSYINDLGFRLVANSADASGRQFYFFIIQDPTLNAFALPGGYVGVHSELFLLADNESELGAVLSHEIAHVTQRHLARGLEKANQISFPTLAAMLGGLIFAATNPEAGIAVLAGAQAGAQQYLINNTRENEAEADRIGMQTMAQVDLDPNGMASFFGKMEQSTRYMRMPPPVLLTHPVTQQRIADARLRAAELPAKAPAPSLVFRLMQAKLHDMVMPDIKQREREINIALRDNPHDVVQHYSAGLLKIRLHQYSEAKAEFEALHTADPENLSYVLALAETMIAAEKLHEAESLLSHYLSLHPNHHALTVAYTKVLLRQGKALEARKLLLAYVSQPDREPSVYQMLANAQQAAGFSDEVHESQGMYLQSLGDLRGALQQYEQARRSRSEDPYSTARINARIKHIQEILFERRRSN